MRYIPNSPAERESLLAAVGVSSVDDLFATVPRAVYQHEPPDLPPPASEIEVRRDLGAVAAKNAHLSRLDVVPRAPASTATTRPPSSRSSSCAASS